MTVRGVVMAGGEGTRLRPLTATMPKPFVRVAGKPVVEYGLDALAQAGIAEVFLTTFYKPEQLIGRLMGGARVGLRLYYSVEDAPLGTAGGVKKVGPFLDDTFVVLSGDVLCDVDVKALLEFHRAKGAEATIALTEVSDPSEFGIVGLDPQGRIERFKEKPKPDEAFSRLVNAGIYVLEPSVLDLVPDAAPFDFSKGLFPRMLEQGRRLYGTRLSGLWMDVGRPSDLLLASRLQGERRFGGPYLEGKTGIAAGARVKATDLYPGARVEAGADVDGCILYDGAVVERDAVLRGTILAPGATVGAGASLLDCVVGADARIRPGARLEHARVGVGEAAPP